MAACRVDHPLARSKRVAWRDLRQYDYITVSKASGNRLLIDQALAGLPDMPQSICEAQHVTTALGLVEAEAKLSDADFVKPTLGQHATNP